MSKSAILITKDHHLYNQVKETYQTDSFEDIKEISLNKYQNLFDFSLGTTSEKTKLFKDLDLNIISDLTSANAHTLHKEFINLKASHASLCYSPKKTYEAIFVDSEIKETTESFFKPLEVNLMEVSAANSRVGFTFPRTLALIINEAYFSLEDELASAHDIDQAMKFGVNYPLGPIEWSKKIGTVPIYNLLNELYKDTNNPRYIPSKLLKSKEQK